MLEQEDLLCIRGEETCDVIKGRSVGPVRDIVYVLVVLNSQCIDFMVVFVVLGASSNRLLFIQEHAG